MATSTMKDARESAEKAIAEGIKNKAALFTALPILVKLQTAAKRASEAAKSGYAIAKELATACGKYALKCPSVFEDGLPESAKGVKSGDLTIDDVTYHFANGYDKPKRLDGGALTQAFLGGLPEGWVKSGLFELDVTGINRAGVTDEELADKGLFRPDTYVWSV